MNDIIKHEWKNCKKAFSLLKKSHSTIMKKNILLFFAAFSLFLETNATTVKINEVEYDLWGTSAGVTSGRSYNGEFLHNNNHYSANSYVIPSSITYEGNAYIVDKITDHCFYDGYASPTYSKSIKKITLPNTIKYIGDEAFRGTGLSNLIIPENVISFSGSGHFTNCDLLTVLIYLPKSAPSNWSATTYTYVPDVTSYSSPSERINNAKIIPMISFAQTSFVYTGQAPSTTWVNNVDGYTASLTMPALEKNVGSYVVYIPVTFTKGSESFSTEVAYRYTIKGVELTAKVNDVSRVYGDNNPAFSITYSGFINGDNESVITTKPTATTTATPTSNVGTYPISISGGVAQNYTLKYETGTLTITKAALEVSVNNATKLYGSENPAFTLNYSGLKNNETKPSWEKSPTFLTAADKNSDVGSYQVSVDCSATNYNITKNNPGTLSITPAALTVKANNASRFIGVR